MARLFVVFFCLLAAPAFALPTVTVMADHSLGIAITRLAREYSRLNQVVVNTSFLPEKTHQAQIIEGGAADILVTQKTSWIDELKTQGLVDVYSQKRIAKNRLALVGPANTDIYANLADAFPIVPIIQAGGGEPSFVVGNPEFLTEGIYTKEALRNLNVADDLGEYTLYVKRLDQMFSMIANNHDYGVFYYSDAKARPDIKIIDTLPESSHKPIEYYAVVVAGDNMNEARKFLSYLQSPEAKKLLKNGGFSVD